MISPDQRRQLDELGYISLPDFMSPDLLNALRQRVDQLFEEEGENAGSEFRQEPGSRAA